METTTTTTVKGNAVLPGMTLCITAVNPRLLASINYVPFTVISLPGTGDIDHGIDSVVWLWRWPDPLQRRYLNPDWDYHLIGEFP